MKRACLLSFILLLFLQFQAVAQNSDWDKVLDRYQEICGQCTTLRDRIVAGEPVSDRAVTTLLQELSQLRNTLQNASGSMTDEQKKRFASIRDSYTGIIGTGGTIQTEPTESTTAPIQPANNRTKATKQTVVEKTDAAPSLSDTAIIHPELTEQIAQTPRQIGYDNINKQERLTIDNVINGEPTPRYRYFIFETYLLAAYNRTLSFGGMIILGNGQARCGYISVLSNFSHTESDYTCSSNGDIEGGGVFWGDGAVTDNQLFITGGTAIWNSNSGKASAYLGAGYGINERLWRDISGKWALVSDVSGRGLVLQTAAAFRLNRIAVSPGLLYMPKSNYLLPSLGIGYSF